VAKSLPVTGYLFGVYRAFENDALFVVEASDSMEANSRIALIAPCLGITDLSEGIAVQLDADDDVTCVPKFYEAYFRGLDASGDGGAHGSATMH
jgi:hypothetical protein